MIEKLKLQNFTVFDQLELEFSPHINIFIGENGTGKTHLLKLMYSIFTSEPYSSLEFDPFYVKEKINGVFLPNESSLARLIRRGEDHCDHALVDIDIDGSYLKINLLDSGEIALDTTAGLIVPVINHVYIPVKEMLGNAPGFRSLYDEREIHFEEVYKDIISKAFLSPKKKLDEKFENLLPPLRQRMRGKIESKGETFFHVGKAGSIEFDLVAEGIRKLALLWLLIANGSLSTGATLYWDEPETNLNPSMLPIVVETLLKLAELGVQVFIATHSYPLLKEFDLQKKKRQVRYFDLHFNENDLVRVNTADKYVNLHPTKIAEEYTRLYELGVKRAMGKSDE